MDRPNFYSVTPATVRYDNRLSGDEKILYGEITALASKEGYCWASNQYFAELYNVGKNTISAWISNLKEAGHINSEVDKLGNRKIYVASTPSKILEAPLPISRDTPSRQIGSIVLNTNIQTDYASDDAQPSFGGFLTQLGVTSEFEGDGEVSELVYRIDGKPISEKKLRQQFAKAHPASPVEPKKAPRTRDSFDFDTWLISLKNSSNKADKIVALIWKEKGYRFENYQQWRSQMDVDGVWARKLVGYSGQQIQDAIDLCEEDSRKRDYEWKASTVVKKIAETMK